MGDRSSCTNKPPLRLQSGLGAGLGLGLCASLAGCAASPLQLLWQGEDAHKAVMQLQVTPAASPGAYTVVGQTDFPDKTPIRIAALRYVYPANPASQKLNPRPTYEILAYQTARVQKGQWQTSLNLWQTAPDGRYQESWQIRQTELGMTFTPDTEVTFLVSLAPGDKADPIQKIEQQLKAEGKVIGSELVRRTGEGDRYVQATQTLAIALPTGGTTPPPPRAEDINGGWGRRYLMPLEPQNPYLLEFPKHRRTDAPAKPAEFMQ